MARAIMTSQPLATVPEPDACQTMTDVRAGVDAVDRALVMLLVRRFGYMDAAARIKTDRSAVRDEARKAAVLAHVAQLADAHGLPAERLVRLWDALVEESIAHELAEWDRLRAERG